jgi:hypothetical protein
MGSKVHRLLYQNKASCSARSSKKGRLLYPHSEDWAIDIVSLYTIPRRLQERR